MLNTLQRGWHGTYVVLNKCLFNCWRLRRDPWDNGTKDRPFTMKRRDGAEHITEEETAAAGVSEGGCPRGSPEIHFSEIRGDT